MSTKADQPPEQPTDPYGIDHERERKLTRIFLGLIGVGFLLVLIMLGIAIALDLSTEGEIISPPPLLLELPADGPAEVSGSHP